MILKLLRFILTIRPRCEVYCQFLFQGLLMGLLELFHYAGIFFGTGAFCTFRVDSLL